MAERFAKPLCDQYATESGLWTHTLLVRKYAVLLAKKEGADLQVVELAAILHDVGKKEGRENHAEHSAEYAKGSLADIALPSEKKDLILKCVRKHGSKYIGGKDEIEVMIVRCADALAVLFDDAMQEECRRKMAKEGLLHLYDKALRKAELPSAHALAMPQVEKLKQILGAKNG